MSKENGDKMLTAAMNGDINTMKAVYKEDVASVHAKDGVWTGSYCCTLIFIVT